MKNNLAHNNRKFEKGQGLVELALTLVVILMLLAGAVDLGIAFFDWVALRDASEEGASFGSIKPETSNQAALEARVVNASTRPLNMVAEKAAGRLRIYVTRSSPICSGGWIKVALEYDYYPIMPGLGAIINPPLILRANATNTILTSTTSGCP